jgi:hypothetical protein
VRVLEWRVGVKVGVDDNMEDEIDVVVGVNVLVKLFLLRD